MPRLPCCRCSPPDGFPAPNPNARAQWMLTPRLPCCRCSPLEGLPAPNPNAMAQRMPTPRLPCCRCSTLGRLCSGCRAVERGMPAGPAQVLLRVVQQMQGASMIHLEPNKK